MKTELKDFIKSHYLENCKQKHYNLKSSEEVINWFFNRFDNFNNYVNFLESHNSYFHAVTKNPQVEYACQNSGLDYFYIIGLIEFWCNQNNTPMYNA
jgi:hypothetical protein